MKITDPTCDLMRNIDLDNLDKLSAWYSTGFPGALEYYLLKKIQKQVHCATGPTFVASLALKKIILKWSVLAHSMYSFRIYSQSPSLKYGRTFLQKKFFMRGVGGGERLGKRIGGCSTWGD